MSLEEQLATLKSHLNTAEQEYLSLKSGRKSAAPRFRKALMNIKTGSHGMRAGATAYVRELPTKSRKAAEPKVVEPEPAEEQPAQEHKTVCAIKPEKSKRAPRKKKPVILDTLPE
jgi:septal ring-binding cell division protein DamX